MAGVADCRQRPRLDAAKFAHLVTSYPVNWLSAIARVKRDFLIIADASARPLRAVTIRQMR